MRQIWIIAARELRVELRKRSFYLFGMISPLLFLIPVLFYYVGRQNDVPSAMVGIGVQSEGLSLEEEIYRGVRFEALSDSLTPEQALRESRVEGVLRVEQRGERLQATLYSEADGEAAKVVSDAEAFLWHARVRSLLEARSVPPELSDQLLMPVPRVWVVNVDENAHQKRNASMVAYVLGMLLYISYILFNNNILKSVSAEKSSKLIEVMSLDVAPEKMMLGKLVGVTAISLLQIVLWCACYVLFLLLLLVWVFWNGELHTTLWSAMGELDKLFQGNLLAELGGWALLFVVLGFLLHGTLSTMLAAARAGRDRGYLLFVGNILSLLAIYFGMYAATSPASSVTRFLIYFPLSSYIVVPVLTPYGVPVGRMAVSLVLLVCTVAVTLFCALRIYRRSVSE